MVKLYMFQMHKINRVHRTFFDIYASSSDKCCYLLAYLIFLLRKNFSWLIFLALDCSPHPHPEPMYLHKEKAMDRPMAQDSIFRF